LRECNSCGKCCIKYSDGGLTAEKYEINNWLDDAPEIAEYVHNGHIWFDPKSKQPIKLCPWLQPSINENSKVTSYSCAIYFNRPNDCRYYPSTFEEMVRDECEMVEAKDLKNPAKARQALEIIMSDSWHT